MCFSHNPLYLPHGWDPLGRLGKPLVSEGDSLEQEVGGRLPAYQGGGPPEIWLQTKVSQLMFDKIDMVRRQQFCQAGFTYLEYHSPGTVEELS